MSTQMYSPANRRVRLLAAAVASATGVALCAAAPADAAGAVPAVIGPPAIGPGADPATSPLTVVATGLANPRGIAVGEHGALYVAEAGRGAPAAVPIPPGGSLVPTGWPCLHVVGPESGQAVTTCFGSTGAVTRIANGVQVRVVTGLPSIADVTGVAAVGLTGITLGRHGRATGVIGCDCDPSNRATSLPALAVGLMGHLVGLDTRNDTFTAGADVAAFELTNPDAGDPGSTLDANPYGIAKGAHGSMIVADAGGNDLLSVDKHAVVSLLAVFHTRTAFIPPFTGLPPGLRVAMQAVPTAVVRGPDGAYYVGQLTGQPYPVGGARVWRVVPGHRPRVFTTGFTNIISLAFDHSGRLVVLELATDGLNDPSSLGALWVVDRYGVKTRVASAGLVMPAGVAIGRDGNAYVTNHSTDPLAGQVVRIDLP